MDKSQTYQINLEGWLDAAWSDWFSGMTITYKQGSPPTTTLTGTVLDQADLRGILAKIWDLNLTVISVNRIEKQQKEKDL